MIKLPDVPVIVTVKVPVAAVAVAVSDSLLVLVAGFGEKAAFTPLGKPDAVNLTLPVKPFSGVMVIVLVPAFSPCTIVTLFGEAERVKFGVLPEFTVRLRVVW